MESSPSPPSPSAASPPAPPAANGAAVSTSNGGGGGGGGGNGVGEPGKLFVGGIPWDATEDALRDYFGKYGDVTEAIIMRERGTGNARGFGFVSFSDPCAADKAIQDTAAKHAILGRPVSDLSPRRLSSSEAVESVGNVSLRRDCGVSRSRFLYDFEWQEEKEEH